MQKSDNPTLHPVVSEAVKGWRNRAPAPRQAGALTADALARVREVLRLPKRGRGGRMESADTARRRAALDLAIIGVLADGGLRRSEAAALTWGDVELWADATGRLTIQKGKNQVEPATVAVTAATARALRDIRPDDVDPAAPVFGLTGEAGQPGEGHSQGCGPGRWFLWTQWPHRHGPADGGGGSAQRGSAAPGPVETWGYGRPLYAGRDGRGSTEMADMMRSDSTADNPMEAAMTDSVQPVCDCPEP